MPYNTRRKSLSLQELGIHVPQTSRSHRSPPKTATTPTEEQQQNSPPAKRVKRSHTSTSAASPPPSQPHSRKPSLQLERPSSRHAAEHTPPPSPGEHTTSVKVDTEGIKDDIVVATIKQLEETGNRPHLVKELAAILERQVPAVESSANPAAIISSRLTTYIRRPGWSALAPCPIAKELVDSHPRRIYFYLTTCPRQPIPEPSLETQLAKTRIISPSLSSNSVRDEHSDREDDTERRRQLSPSPEVDLSTPELEGDDDGNVDTPGGSFHSLSTTSSHAPTASNMLHNRQAQAVAPDRDEREFTLMVSKLLKRKMSTTEQVKEELSREPSAAAEGSPDASSDQQTIAMQVDAPEKTEEQQNSEAAAALFGQEHNRLALPAQQHIGFSSPLMKPQPDVKPEVVVDDAERRDSVLVPEKPEPAKPEEPTAMSIDQDWSWSDIRDCEDVGLDELDDMLAGY